MSYVGDVHLQLEVAVGHAAHADGVVEIARGLAVDGDDGQRAIIATVAQLGRRDERLELLRLLQHLDGKFMWQVVLADDDLDIHAEVVFIAEDLDDAAARVLRRRRPIGDLDVNHQAFEVVPLAAAGFAAEDAITLLLAFARRFSERCLGRRFLVSARPLHAARDDDFLRDLLVHRRDVVVPRAVMERADDAGIAAAQHAQDAAFGAAVFLLAAKFHQDLVAVHGRADGLRVDEDVAGDGAALAGVGDDEAVAVAVHRQASGDEVLAGGGVLGEGVAVTGGFDQAAGFDQRLQALGELLPLAAPQAHLADELLESGRAVGLAFDVAQDGLIGNHVRVTADFAESADSLKRKPDPRPPGKSAVDVVPRLLVAHSMEIKIHAGYSLIYELAVW